MNVARIGVRNPVFANLLMWAIVIAGLWCAANLIREFFPTIESDQILVTVPYPGATPEEIEKAVTRRLEREVEGIDLVEEITSQVVEGVSLTVLELEEGADRQQVMGDVRDAVDRVRPDLPEGAEDPEITLVRPYFPAISLVLYGEVGEKRLNATARRIKDELLALPEISQLVVSGIREREFQIEVEPTELERYGLTFEEVGQAVARRNLDLPGGRLESPEGNVGVRTMGETDVARELESLVVRSQPGGRRVLLSDLGRIRDTFEDRVEKGRFAGQPAVLITIFKGPEQDAIDVAQRIKDYVAKNGDRIGAGLSLDTLTDLSRFVQQRLDLMIRSGRAGLILVAIALAIFLDLKVAFWVTVGLPISFLGTFLVMYFTGATINLISLFGLIVVLGLLVDDAIVIGENIFTKYQEGMKPMQAAIEGTREVTLPVLAAILTTCAAFAPLAFIDGRVGTLMRQLPIVVIAALGVSLVEAFLILPAHLGHLRAARDPSRIPLIGPAIAALVRLRKAPLERWGPAAVEATLRLFVRWRYLVLACALTTLVIASGVIRGGLVPFELLQEADAETITVDVEMTAGTREETTLAVVQQFEERALAIDEVDKTFSVVGTSFSDRGRQTATDPATVGQITLELLPAEERQNRGMRNSDDVVAALREVARTVPGARKIKVAARSGGPGGADIEVRLLGEDLDELARSVRVVRSELEGYAAVEEIEDDLVLGKLEVRLSLRPAGEALGLTTGDLALQVRHALFGFEIQELQQEREEIQVRVLLPESSRDEIADLARLRLRAPDGARVPLLEAARLETTRGYATISRVDGRRAVTIRAEVNSRRGNTGQITGGLTAALAARLPEETPGIDWSFEGEKKETQESLGSLRYGFPFALFLVYAIVAILFRSYFRPLVVMASIPFSIFGAIMGHLIMGYPLTLLSLIGIVALAGIVVNDSLILVSFIDQRRREGRETIEAVIAGARDRFRAIMLTSITTVLGLIPLMLERSFQAQFLIPMAISLVFGLAWATFVTPVLLPLIYVILDDVLRGIGWVIRDQARGWRGLLGGGRSQPS